MHSPRSRPAPVSKIRIALMNLGFFGMVVVAVVGFWWATAMKTPVVVIPNPIMPSPNAFDFYVKAGDAMVYEKEIKNAVSVQPTVAYSLAQKEELVQQNAGVIDTIHAGFAYPYMNPPYRSLYTDLPYYAQFRGLARLLSLRGQVRAERGDWSGAADSYLDAIALAEAFPYGSSILGSLVGIACEAIGRIPLWDVIEHLNAAQSHAALTRLERLLIRRLPYAEMMQQEEWTGQAALLEIFNDPKKRVSLFTDAEGPKEANAGGVNSPSPLFYLAHSKSHIMHNYTTMMERNIELARHPYGAHSAGPPLTDDPITRLFGSLFAEARLKEAACMNQNGLMLVSLALNTYRLNHGRYPVSLFELTPATIKELPEDPFAVDDTFKYKSDGRTCLLYSVGPDGNDDGGTPIDNGGQTASSRPNTRYAVVKDSVGDVVAGKNRW